MKKFAALMAGVAAIATAGAASAQTAVATAKYVNPANPGNSGTLSDDVTATFTLQGNVDAACVFGGTLPVLDFGTLGIYADGSSGVEKAFTLVGAANGHVRTNLAGCNTANTVTITKGGLADGMVNTSAVTAGYDTNVFQANLPYSVFARYTAGAEGVTGAATTRNFAQSVSTTGAPGISTHGAWKSEMTIRVDIPVPTKALVAGEYSDTVTIELTAS